MEKLLAYLINIKRKIIIFSVFIFRTTNRDTMFPLSFCRVSSFIPLIHILVSTLYLICV